MCYLGEKRHTCIFTGDLGNGCILNCLLMGVNEMNYSVGTDDVKTTEGLHLRKISDR